MYTGRGDDGTSSLFGQPERLPKTAAIFSALGALDELNSWLGVCKTFSKLPSTTATSTDELTPAAANSPTPTGPSSTIAITLPIWQQELVPGYTLPQLLHFSQEQLFTLQAALAGAGAGLTPAPVQLCEQVVLAVTTQLPPIKTFLIPGGTLLAAHLDYARAITRRAEIAVLQALSTELTPV